MRLADYVIERMYDECAAHIFLVTGRGILYLSDAVARHKELEGISVHHEQAAAFAATAYGAYTGKPGICLVSTGCASTNAITGLLCAWQDGIPCIFISGQNPLEETVNYTGLPIRTFGSQETDIIPIIQSLTKYAVMIDDPNKIAYELDKAMYYSQQGRKGPAWIDIPVNIQNMHVEPEHLERFTTEIDRDEVKAEYIKYVKQAFEQAKRPVLLIGNGVRSAGGISELEEFVGSCGIPLTYAHSATDIYGPDNELSIGAVGALSGTRAGNFAVQNSDLLLVLGCRMSSMTTGSYKNKFAREAKVIVVDIDKDEHTKDTTKIDKLIVSDAKVFVSALLNADIKPANEEWKQRCLHWKELFPKCEEKYKESQEVDLYYLADCLTKTMPDESVFICDAGFEELILPSNIGFKKGMRCIHPAMQGAMGFALPAAIGAHYASQKPVAAVIGDGSFMMNLQELETIRYNKLPIKIIVINNDLYSVIRRRQKEVFRTRTIGTDPSNGLSCPEMVKVADCFGLEYLKIENSEGLSEKLDILFQTEGAVLCEIIGVRDQEYIREAVALNSQKRIVRRPIEDMAPFLDRDVFISEMIIEPIDQ